MKYLILKDMMLTFAAKWDMWPRHSSRDRFITVLSNNRKTRSKQMRVSLPVIYR